jgi:flagellar basal body P-ring protein FlgI
MIRRVGRGCLSFRARIVAPALLAAGLLALVGCLNPQTRLQSEEETERERYAVKTIGDVTEVANSDPIPVAGVGLVVGLNGTGSTPPSNGYRTMLEADLLKRGVENVKKVLASPDVSLVLVQAMIPPGAHKDDLIDVEVTLPPGSRTTSLRGGRLIECMLYNYDSARNLSGQAVNSDAMLKGHPLAKAEGTLLVGFGSGDEAARVKQGRIWGGARVRTDRPFYLVLNQDQQYARVASNVADRINETFQGRSYGGPTTELAAAKTNTGVYLNVPPQYKHNLPRFLRVVRMIPLRTEAASGDIAAYRRKLSEDLLDPAFTVMAALRLEALGKDSAPTLKRGLQNERPLVRFTAAEALAYLGEPSCGEELGRMVEQYPDLRAFGLTALASLDEAISRVKLRELLASSSPEVRYGAFRALRALDEHDPAVHGEFLNESFWLHRIMPNSEPLVHFSTNRRAEIVLFGEDALLQGPFSIMAGEFTLTAGAGDSQCLIGHFSPEEHVVNRRQCSLRVEDVIRALADEGAMYPEVVEFLRQAKLRGHVACRVEIDALPQATSVYDLALAGRRLKEGKEDETNVDPALIQSDAEIQGARADLGATPTLFDTGRRQPRTATLQNERGIKEDKKTTQREE